MHCILFATTSPEHLFLLFVWVMELNHNSKCKHFGPKNTLYLKANNVIIITTLIMLLIQLFTNLNINFYACPTHFLDGRQHPKWEVCTISNTVSIAYYTYHKCYNMSDNISHLYIYRMGSLLHQLEFTIWWHKTDNFF